MVFVFLLQIRRAVAEDGPIYLFAVFSAVVWLLWVVKVVLSRRYRPWTQPYHPTTSVVIPVVDEPPAVFRDVLSRVTAQRPDQVIVVINGPRNPALAGICAELGVCPQWTPMAGKRNAVRLGVAAATAEIVVLVDSDTLWTDGTLAELVKPFAEPTVGGVTTRQRILRPNRCLITRWADWLENSRALYAMPAQSVLGQVGCLPGRTIAFRRELLVRVMDRFLTDRFLGVFLEISDDRTLTNLTLQAGYRTVYQYTSLVYTDVPTRLSRLFRQQLRWARGSQYNTLRMLPWMLAHAPLLAVFFLADIALPFLLLGAVIGWAYRSTTGTGVDFYGEILASYGLQSGLPRVIALAVVASMLSMGIRQLRHLAERPADFLWLPLFVAFSTLFLIPVRLIGFVRMAHSSAWGTRRHAYAGGRSGGAAGGAGADAAGAAAAVAVPARAAAPGSAAPGSARPVGAAGPPAVPRPGHRLDIRSRRRHRRLNLQAAIPYLIGILIIALEVLHHA